MKKRKETIEKMPSQNKKCGFVAIVGEPNVGKSTLINNLVERKISIVSDKAQTTRKQVRGILTHNNVQIVFIDTPGFFRPKTNLEHSIISNFKASYHNVHVILLVIDATARSLVEAKRFLEKLRESDSKISVVINKIDISKKNNLLPIAALLAKYDFVENIFMVSAKNNDGVGKLQTYLQQSMPDGNWMYSEDEKTDLDIKLQLSEITREKLFLLLREELPYSIYVETEVLRETDKKAKVWQSIVVIKNSQKGIVLGAGGKNIKKIRELSTLDMKNLLQKKIELKLFVKVKEKWTEKKDHLKNAGIIGF